MTPPSAALHSPEKRRFRDELRRLGPDQPPTTWGVAAAERYCRQWARASYENFTVVSWLLPRRYRQDFHNIYAYCRWSDDLADEVEDSAESLRLLDWWQQQLGLCFSGRPVHPVMIALQQTIHKYAIPNAPFCDLLDAFRQDQVQWRYGTDAELHAYCQRSANPVGRILLRIADCDSADHLALSDQICTGLQLANFCQDMQRDAGMGRIYLPRERWERHGVNEAMLLERRPNDRLRQALAEWIADTRNYFDRGRPLIKRLPAWLATDVELFWRGGVEVLNCIERQGYDVWTRRPSISKLARVRLLGRSLGERGFGFKRETARTPQNNR